MHKKCWLERKNTAVSSENTLDKTSSIAFLLGLIASRIQVILNATLLPYANILSLSFYLIGYISWFALNYFFPNKTKPTTEWSAFAQFKVQHILAAMIGIIATAFSFAAITIPILLIPAGWLFLCSNMFWSIGEYNKYKIPPENSPVSASYQENYLKFAVTMTAMSLVSALALTLSFIFPPLGLSILVTTAVINIGLGFMVLEYWLKCTFEKKSDEKTDELNPSPSNSSYASTTAALGLQLTCLARGLPPPPSVQSITTQGCTNTEVCPPQSPTYCQRSSI